MFSYPIERTLINSDYSEDLAMMSTRMCSLRTGKLASLIVLTICQYYLAYDALRNPSNHCHPNWLLLRPKVPYQIGYLRVPHATRESEVAGRQLTKRRWLDVSCFTPKRWPPSSGLHSNELRLAHTTSWLSSTVETRLSSGESKTLRIDRSAD